jgi:DNA-binding LytR/AlgR family response regulator
MKALIADDEPHLAQYLREMLASTWPELEILASVTNGPDAGAAIERERPDVAFLDIRMPGETGLDVAARVARNPALRTRIVFVTAFDQYAVDAFERDAIDYLLKPVTRERLARTIEKLRRASAPQASELSALVAEFARRLPAPTAYLRWFRASKRSLDGEITQQIPVDDVIYIQADDKYTCIHSRDGKDVAEWLIRIPLSELALQLDPAQFAQIHRSVIVNLSSVSSTRRDLAGKLFVRLRDHSRELPVSRQYVHLFQKM